MICVLSGKKLLDEVLEVFLAIGISGATVIQSQGMSIEEVFASGSVETAMKALAAELAMENTERKDN